MKPSILKICIWTVLSVQAIVAHAAGGDDAKVAVVQVSARDYILQPLDKLSFEVFNEPLMARTVRISAENTIVLPLIGQIDLKGKTLRQAESAIRELLDRDYLVNPQVNLSVLEYAPRYVNMVGQFNSPKKVEFPQEKELRLIDAITLAGSFTRLADQKHVKLIRTLADGTTETRVINCEKLIFSSAASSSNQDNVLLQPNDTISVDEIGVF